VLTLIMLSYMGLPQYGIEANPATRIIEDMMPERRPGTGEEIPYDQLQAGAYEVNVHTANPQCPKPGFRLPPTWKKSSPNTPDEWRKPSRKGIITEIQALMIHRRLAART